jgi:hypothetical protein
MKYSEGYRTDSEEVGSIIKRTVANLLAGNLVVEGEKVKLPEDRDLDFKVKYANDEEGGSVTLKISYDNEIEEEEAEEEV